MTKIYARFFVSPDKSGLDNFNSLKNKEGMVIGKACIRYKRSGRIVILIIAVLPNQEKFLTNQSFRS